MLYTKVEYYIGVEEWTREKLSAPWRQIGERQQQRSVGTADTPAWAVDTSRVTRARKQQRGSQLQRDKGKRRRGEDIGENGGLRGERGRRRVVRVQIGWAVLSAAAGTYHHLPPSTSPPFPPSIWLNFSPSMLSVLSPLNNTFIRSEKHSNETMCISRSWTLEWLKINASSAVLNANLNVTKGQFLDWLSFLQCKAIVPPWCDTSVHSTYLIDELRSIGQRQNNPIFNLQQSCSTFHPLLNLHPSACSLGCVGWATASGAPLQMTSGKVMGEWIV